MSLICCYYKFLDYSDSKHATIADLIGSIFADKLGFNLNAVASLMRSDRAAIGVSALCHIEEDEACFMHDGEKVSASATGRLVRKKKKTQVNPFNEGTELIQLCQDLAVWWGVGDRVDTLFGISDSFGDGTWPKVKLQVAHNTTRIAAPHMLLFSVLKMSNNIKAYQTYAQGRVKELNAKSRSKKCPQIEECQWKLIQEMEGVLAYTQMLTKLAQKENAYMGAYGAVIKSMVYQQLKSRVVKIVDIDGNLKKPSRIEVGFDSLSNFGKQVLLRAIVEMERRFMGNDSNIPYPDDIWGDVASLLNYPETTDLAPPTRDMDRNDILFFESKNREKVCLLLDIRTCCAAQKYMCLKDGIDALEDEYIEFGLVMHKYKANNQSEVVPMDSSDGARLDKIKRMKI